MVSGVPNDAAKRAAYMQHYRANRTPEMKERQKALMRARSRATSRLAGLHPEDFEMLMQEELEKEGLHGVKLRGVRKSRD